MSSQIRYVLSNTNWTLLRRQKQWLQAQDTTEAEGLIHFIDALQDVVVSDGIATEDEVFNA